MIKSDYVNKTYGSPWKFEVHLIFHVNNTWTTQLHHNYIQKHQLHICLESIHDYISIVLIQTIHIYIYTHIPTLCFYCETSAIVASNLQMPTRSHCVPTHSRRLLNSSWWSGRLAGPLIFWEMESLLRRCNTHCNWAQTFLLPYDDNQSMKIPCMAQERLVHTFSWEVDHFCNEILDKHYHDHIERMGYSQKRTSQHCVATEPNMIQHSSVWSRFRAGDIGSWYSKNMLVSTSKLCDELCDVTITKVLICRCEEPIEFDI